jgi:hypothetical protein
VEVEARAVTLYAARAFFSGNMHKQARGNGDHGQAERHGGDGVQEVAQLFVKIEKAHGKSPSHLSTPIGG